MSWLPFTLLVILCLSYGTGIIIRRLRQEYSLTITHIDTRVIWQWKGFKIVSIGYNIELRRK